ncbi:IclR family transcriptional regulator [Gordonia polyisoprenivorans]|uniref:IclR family transcriptional regulator n=1 Tax=Gordonia polyisoprenivorans TaxID=84595 RepID=UPI00244E4927|nr:IclR family transcriptional regulator [Gordonia polyisoprenivorans]
MTLARADSGGDAQSSVGKVLQMIEYISGRGGKPFRVTEIAAHVGLPKSTAHRLLKELADRDFVGRLDAKYVAGGALATAQRTSAGVQHERIREMAYQSMAWLFERSDAMAVHLAVLDGFDVLYLDKLTKPAGTRLPSRVGGRVPANCTALGKALLAFEDRARVESVMSKPLPRITPYSVSKSQQLAHTRRVGFASEREEACQGWVCVAAPIMGRGRPVASISLCVPSITAARSIDVQLAAWGRLSMEAAAGASRMIGPA